MADPKQRPWELTKQEFKAADPGYRRKWPTPPARPDDPRRPIGTHERFVREAIRRGEKVPDRVLADYPRYVWGPKLTKIERLCHGKLLYLRARKDQLQRCIRKGRIDFTLPVWSHGLTMSNDGVRIAKALMGDKVLGILELTQNPYSIEGGGRGYRSEINQISHEIAFLPVTDKATGWLDLEPWLSKRVSWAVSEYPIRSWILADLLASRRLTMGNIPANRRDLRGILAEYDYLEVQIREDAKLRSFCGAFFDSSDAGIGRLNKRPSWWPEMMAWASRGSSSIPVKRWKDFIDPESQLCWEPGTPNRIEHYERLVYVAAAWAWMKGDDGIIIPPDKIWIFRPSALRILGESVEKMPLMLGDEVDDLVSLGIPVEDDVRLEVHAMPPDFEKSLSALERTERLILIIQGLVGSLPSLDDMRSRAEVASRALEAYKLLVLSMVPVARAATSLWGRRFLCVASTMPMPGQVIPGDPVEELLNAWSRTMSYEWLQQAQSTAYIVSDIKDKIHEYRLAASSAGKYGPSGYPTPVDDGLKNIYYSLPLFPWSSLIGWHDMTDLYKGEIDRFWGAPCQG